MGRAVLKKSLIQFSVDGQGCVPSLLFDLRPKYGGGDEDNGDLLHKVPGMHCCIHCPPPCSGLPATHASPGEPWTLTGKSGSVSCGVTAPFSGSWRARGFVCALQEPVSPVLGKVWQLCGGAEGDILQEGCATPRTAAPRAPAPVAGHC